MKVPTLETAINHATHPWGVVESVQGRTRLLAVFQTQSDAERVMAQFARTFGEDYFYQLVRVKP